MGEYGIFVFFAFAIAMVVLFRKKKLQPVMDKVCEQGDKVMDPVHDAIAEGADKLGDALEEARDVVVDKAEEAVARVKNDEK